MSAIIAPMGRDWRSGSLFFSRLVGETEQDALIVSLYSFLFDPEDLIIKQILDQLKVSEKELAHSIVKFNITVSNVEIVSDLEHRREQGYPFRKDLEHKLIQEQYEKVKT